MIGGSYNYAYKHVEVFLNNLQIRDNPLRQAFKEHLIRVASAMQAIEWADSMDSSQERADAEIIKVWTSTHTHQAIVEALEAQRYALDNAIALLKRKV